MAAICRAPDPIPRRPTTMLQQNNNNNYPCLEMARAHREVLQECRKSSASFASHLEFGDLPLIKGFRAWAVSGVCTKSRQRAPTLPPTPSSCQQPADAVQVRQRGRLGPGQASDGLVRLPLDTTTASNLRAAGIRQGGLGALVTVATLKASEGGRQTQTRCLFLKAEGCSYLCAVGSHKACPMSLVPRSCSALVGSWLEQTVGGSKNSSSGKKGNQDMGGDAGAFKVKPRSIRKWRTSCNAAISIEKRATPQSREDVSLLEMEESLENGAKRNFLSIQLDTQRGKHARGITKREKLQCHRTRDGRLSSGDQWGAVAEQDQSSGNVLRREVDWVDLPRSKSCSLQVSADLKTCSIGSEARGTSGEIPNSGTNSIGEATEAMRPVNDLEVDDIKCGLKGNIIINMEFKEQRGVGLIPEVELPHRSVSAHSPERHCHSDMGQAYEHCFSGDPKTTLTSTICPSDVRASNNQEKQTELINKASSAEVQLCEGPLQEEGEQVIKDEELLNCAHSYLEEGIHPGGEENEEALLWLIGSEGKARLVRDPCLEFGLVLAGPEHGTEDRCRATLCSAQSREGGSRGRRDAEIGQSGNSPSQGPEATPGTAVAAVVHAQPNPTPPGAMATGLPGPRREQSETGGGAPALLSHARPREQQRGRDGGKAATDGVFVDAVHEGEDEFGIFMQAGEHPLWEDGFAEFHQVPCGKRESNAALTNPTDGSEPTSWTSDWTACPFHQSEDTWTAFTQETDCQGEGQQMVSGGPWWPSNAVEDTKDRLSSHHNVPSVFLEAFPAVSPLSSDFDGIPTLEQLLQGSTDQKSAAVDHGERSLLEGFQDLNRMICLKYKRAESPSRKLLLQSLHLDWYNSEHVTDSQQANDRLSPGLPMSSQQTPATAKRRLSYDINRSILA